MREHSPYEGTFDSLNGKTALGHVVDVDVANRRCHVKTIGMQGPKSVSGRQTGAGTEDHDLFDVQWITTSSSDSGAEDTSIPQVGQTGVIIYINHEPYLVGFFRTLQPSPQDNPNPVINPLGALVTQGDRLLSTTGDNSLILRSGGSIEIRSTELCKTYWLPGGIYTTDCGDYELNTDSGYVSWEGNSVTNNGTLEYFIQDNLEPTNAILAQYGTSSNDNIAEVYMGALDTNLDITTPAFHYAMTPKGTIDIEIGGTIPGTPNFSATIDAATGDAAINTQGTLTAVVQGDVSLTTQAALTATVQGDIAVTGHGTLAAIIQDDVSLDTKGALSATVQGDTALTGQGAITLTASGSAELNLSGGTVALGGPAAELLDLINQTLEAIQLIMVPTVMGPSGVPLNAATFASIASLLGQIKGTL